MNFPSSPTIGDKYTFGSNVWEFDGVAWNKIQSEPFVDYDNLLQIAGLTDPLSSSLFGFNISTGNIEYFQLKTINGTSLLGAGDISLSSGSVEWADILNKPLTFTPSSHSHVISDVTGLQTALDSKLSSFAETDPVFTASPSFGITGTNITNWNSAFSWGNHASAGYQAGLVSGTNIKTVNGTSMLGSGDIVTKSSVLDNIISSASAAFNNNKRRTSRINEDVSLIVSGGYVPSYLSKVYSFGDSSPPFAYSGGDLSLASGFASFNSTTISSTKQPLLWNVSFNFDGDEISLLLDHADSDGYRFIVDGAYVDTLGTKTYGTSETHYRLKFSSSKIRTITVEGRTTLRFGYAYVRDSNTIFYPEFKNQIKAFFVGDSNAELFGYDQKGNSYAAVLFDFLGIQDYTINAIQSTGLMASVGGNNYQTRQNDWLLSDGLDLIVFSMSWNDYAYGTTGYTPAQIKTAAKNLIDSVKTAFPNAVVLIHGVITWDLTTPSWETDLIAIESAVNEGVNEYNDDSIIFVPILSDTDENPIHGNSLAGTGNAGLYVNTGIDHLNEAGNRFVGEWLANKVLVKINQVSGISGYNLNTAAVYVENELPEVVQQTSSPWRSANNTASSTFTMPSTFSSGNTVLLTFSHYNENFGRASSVTIGGVQAVLDYRYVDPSNNEFCTEIWRASPSSGNSVVINWSNYGGSIINYVAAGAVEVSGLLSSIEYKSQSFGTSNPVYTGSITPEKNSFIISSVATVGNIVGHTYSPLGTQQFIWMESDAVTQISGVSAYSIQTSSGSIVNHQWNDAAVERWISLIVSYKPLTKKVVFPKTEWDDILNKPLEIISSGIFSNASLRVHAVSASLINSYIDLDSDRIVLSTDNDGDFRYLTLLNNADAPLFFNGISSYSLLHGGNIKTINSNSILGSGNIAVQPSLVSGSNIKTINSNSLLGSGNILINQPEALGVTDFWTEHYFSHSKSVLAGSIMGPFDVTTINSGTFSPAVPSSGFGGGYPYGTLLRSATSANGGVRIQSSAVSTDYFGAGTRRFICAFMPATSFTGRTVYIGFHNSTNEVEPTDGAYVKVSGSTYQFITRNNGTATIAASGTLTLHVKYFIDIEVYSDASSVVFNMVNSSDGFSVNTSATSSTNIPSGTSRTFGVGMVATESSTTASDICVIYRMGFGTSKGCKRALGLAYSESLSGGGG